MDTTPQHKTKYDWLKQYQWQKGQSGNPKGIQGKSLKTFARELFIKMNPEEKARFLKILDPDFVWKMGEGNPETKVDLDADIKTEHLHKLESETAEILKQLNEPHSS